MMFEAFLYVIKHTFTNISNLMTFMRDVTTVWWASLDSLIVTS